MVQQVHILAENETLNMCSLNKLACEFSRPTPLRLSGVLLHMTSFKVTLDSEEEFTTNKMSKIVLGGGL